MPEFYCADGLLGELQKEYGWSSSTPYPVPFQEHSLRFWAQKRDPTLRDVQQNLGTYMEVIEVRYPPTLCCAKRCFCGRRRRCTLYTVSAGLACNRIIMLQDSWSGESHDLRCTAELAVRLFSCLRAYSTALRWHCACESGIVHSVYRSSHRPAVPSRQFVACSSHCVLCAAGVPFPGART